MGKIAVSPGPVARRAETSYFLRTFTTVGHGSHGCCRVAAHLAGLPEND